MRYLFILNPAAGKQDCTVQLIPQLQQAAVRAGIPVDAVAPAKQSMQAMPRHWLAPRLKRPRKQGSSCTSGRQAAMVLWWRH